MHRLARSLDGLDTVSGSVVRITASSESLRNSAANKKRRARRVRRQRSQSEDNISRRETRREERLRRARESTVLPEEDDQENEQDKNNRPPTPTSARKKVKRLSQAKHGTSTDDEDSDVVDKRQMPAVRKIGRTVIRNLDREPRSGYRPSTDGES